MPVGDPLNDSGLRAQANDVPSAITHELMNKLESDGAMEKEQARAVLLTVLENYHFQIDTEELDKGNEPTYFSTWYKLASLGKNATKAQIEEFVTDAVL